MKVKANICDICWNDGKINLATAEYKDEEFIFDCCEKHLGIVISENLEFWPFNELGNLEDL